MGNKGLTLIEIVVVLLISSILIATMYTLLLSQQTTYIKQDQADAANDEVHRWMSRPGSLPDTEEIS
jgi:prepilin-type N-terminal cleavage/methylation domain-containing protein